MKKAFNPKFFIFDTDDTLVDTELAICNIIQRDHGFTCPPDTYLNPENTGGYHGRVLAEAKFMGEAPLFDHTVKLFEAIPELHMLGTRFAMCTHRGYHPDGEGHTMDLLYNHDVNDYFEAVHVIDYNKIPDKVAFLDAQYGAGQYYLFDDRPRFDQGHPVPDHVWLFDRPWNQHIEGNRTTDILRTILQLSSN